MKPVSDGMPDLSDFTATDGTSFPLKRDRRGGLLKRDKGVDVSDSLCHGILPKNSSQYKKTEPLFKLAFTYTDAVPMSIR